MSIHSTDPTTVLPSPVRVQVGIDAAVVANHHVCVHVRLVDRRLVINSGSIGMPYGRAGGSWALLTDGQVSLRHTVVDLDAAVHDIVDGSNYPERASWANEYVRAASSDADAIAAFTPKEDRPAAT